MADVIEHIKKRLVEAHRKFGEATNNLQRAQTEHQSAQREFATWQHALQIEQSKAAAPQAVGPFSTQAHAIQAVTEIVKATHTAPTVAVCTTQADNTENKTETVRVLLSKSSHGLTPAEVWEALKGQMDRTYLYSVLKRLKDKKQVSVRRGRYYFNLPAKPEESKEAMVLQ